MVKGRNGIEADNGEVKRLKPMRDAPARTLYDAALNENDDRWVLLSEKQYMASTPPLTLRDIFSHGGLISQHLEGYEFRQEQLQMAHARRSLADRLLNT